MASLQGWGQVAFYTWSYKWVVTNMDTLRRPLTLCLLITSFLVSPYGTSSITLVGPRSPRCSHPEFRCHNSLFRSPRSPVGGMCRYSLFLREVSIVLPSFLPVCSLDTPTDDSSFLSFFLRPCSLSCRVRSLLLSVRRRGLT